MTISRRAASAICRGSPSAPAAWWSTRAFTPSAGRREQGVRFFVDENGSKAEEVASEVDRYCSWPGQACGYKVGHSEINRQRDRAKAALGPRFDIKAFDDAVVLGGNVPMDVLAKNVDDYIRSAKARLARCGDAGCGGNLASAATTAWSSFA